MIILASNSPRRKELLKQIGCDFEVVVPLGVEELKGSKSRTALVLENAKRKSLAISEMERPVLSADTVVSICDGANWIFLGKPQDKEEARKMLKMLSAKMHIVTTGLILRLGHFFYTDIVETKVYFSRLTDDKIASYIETKEPFGKAGGYAIQGRAAVFIYRIEGSYSNVVGLPLFSLAQLLEKAGIALPSMSFAMGG